MKSITAIPWLYLVDGIKEENKKFSEEGHIMAKHVKNAIEEAQKNNSRSGGLSKPSGKKFKDHFDLCDFDLGIKYRSIEDGARGFHSNPDGSTSSNQDYLVGHVWTMPVVTNSLAPHYLKWYFHLLPENDLSILRKIELFGVEGKKGWELIK